MTKQERQERTPAETWKAIEEVFDELINSPAMKAYNPDMIAGWKLAFSAAAQIMKANNPYSEKEKREEKV